MKNLKVVFMGTPDFCLPILKMLNDNYQVVGVVTQPDKQVGRKKEISFSPVKKMALSLGLNVLQPVKIRTDYEDILKLNADIIITCAYGQIVPEVILKAPRYGCINVHASLLPLLRGGAPIHKAIIYGLKQTGITIMYMDNKMDTGDIISKRPIKIENCDTAQTLHDKLKDVAVSLLEETLPEILSGTNKREKQDDSKATYAYNVTREEEHVDFNDDSIKIYNKIRGLNSWPGAYSLLDEKPIKLWMSKVYDKKLKSKPGTIIDINKEGILVATKDNGILITELQLPGKRKTLVKDFINGIKKEDYIGKTFE